MNILNQKTNPSSTIKIKINKTTTKTKIASTKKNHIKPLYIKPHLGLTLIEALVAIIVFSIGLLGMIKLLSISSRLQNNMEYQLQANLIAGNIREVLADASSGGQDASTNPSVDSFPAFIEGFLDGARCNTTFQTCNNGRAARESLDQQNQNLYSANALIVNIGHGTLINNDVNFTGACNDPIFARIEFQIRSMQTSQNNNQAPSRTVRYIHPVGQYRMINGSPAFWGVGCN